jgi:membrane associated rhomboid family serine protease
MPVPRPGGPTGEGRRPIVTAILVAINVAVYIYTSLPTGFLVETAPHYIRSYGFRPSYFLTDPARALFTAFMSMFIHADIIHIFFNMYFLWIFGSRVEKILGHGRYVALYFLSGLAAILFHTSFIPIGGYTALTIPAVGASGAISGILGAFLLLFPHTSLSLCLFMFFMPVCFTAPAYAFLLFWFAQQVIYGYLRLGGVAYFAHVGGFVMGLYLIPHLYKPRAQRPAYYERVLRILQVSRHQGLGAFTKGVLIALLLAIVAGFAYSAYFSYSTPVYHAKVSAAPVGRESYEEVFYVYVVREAASTTLIENTIVRITVNRLVPLLYTPSLASSEVSNTRRNYIVTILGVTVPVDLYIEVFRFDEHGVLVYGVGRMDTESVVIEQNVIRRGERMVIEFRYDGLNVDASPITIASLLSIALALFSIASVLRSDEVVVTRYLPLPETYPYL